MGKYYLMHKNHACASMRLDEDDVNAKPHEVKINESERNHFPIGGKMNNMKFNDWWKDRAIPKTRQGSQTALQRLGYKTTANALISNMALSLTDCYWIKPSESQHTWEEVSLFSNNFQDVFGELTFCEDGEVDFRKETDFLKSVSTQGEVQKKWGIDENNRRFLIKGNYGNSYQQSINEVFATRLHEKQQWNNYVPYMLTKINLKNNTEGLGCLSYNFCNENVESISAWELLQTRRIKRDESLYYPFREICLDLGVKAEEFDNFMDYQIMTDFILTNTDRHMNNISILRNPDTLEVIGLAPIYDTGNSMFYNLSLEEMNKVQLGCEKIHSFVTSREVNLLKYVKNRNILNLDKCDIDFSIYEKDIQERHSRIDKVNELYKRKAGMIEEFQRGKNIWIPKEMNDKIIYSFSSEKQSTIDLQQFVNSNNDFINSENEKNEQTRTESKDAEANRLDMSQENTEAIKEEVDDLELF